MADVLQRVSDFPLFSCIPILVSPTSLLLQVHNIPHFKTLGIDKYSLYFPSLRSPQSALHHSPPSCSTPFPQQ